MPHAQILQESSPEPQLTQVSMFLAGGEHPHPPLGRPALAGLTRAHPRAAAPPENPRQPRPSSASPRRCGRPSAVPLTAADSSPRSDPCRAAPTHPHRPDSTKPSSPTAKPRPAPRSSVARRDDAAPRMARPSRAQRIGCPAPPGASSHWLRTRLFPRRREISRDSGSGCHGPAGERPRPAAAVGTRFRTAARETASAGEVGVGGRTGRGVGTQVQPVADQLLLSQEDVEAAPEETRGERWAGGPGTGLMVVGVP